MTIVSSATNKRATYLDIWLFVLASFWTILIAGLAGWEYRESYSFALATARSNAGDSFTKDQLYRRWASEHGGVYVPITTETPPNPYLAHVPERDIVTPSGKKLTLMNPAYMTRQVHELGEQTEGMLGHITSLKPIRPENAPDEWEKAALLAFERGEKEVSSLEVLDNHRYLRFMRPLVTAQGCLKCHASQGYHLGDVRGGISVSVPWAPSQAAINAHVPMLLMTYGGIWAFGILALCFFRNSIQRHLSSLRRVEQSQQEAIDQLQREKEVSDQIINSLPGAFYMFDEQRFVRWNKNWETTTGYSAREVGEMYGPDFFEGADRLHIMERMQAVFRTGNADAEAEIATKDGRRIPHYFTGSRVMLHGKPHLIGLGIDITERKHTLDLLHSSQQLIEGIINAIPARVFWKDKDLVYLGCNAAFARDAGFAEPKDTIGKDDYQMGWRAQADLYRNDDRQVIDSGCPKLLLEEPQTTPQGNTITLLTNKIPLRNSQGEISGVLGTYLDITDRKRLEERQAGLSRILEESLNEIYVFRVEDLKFVEVNKGARQNTGYSIEELRTMTPLDLKPEFTRRSFNELVSLLLAGERETIVFETIHRRKDGSDYQVEIHLQCLAYDGRPVFVAIIMDISDRKRVEQELQRAKLAAEAANRAKSEFLANMSHEIRTPITAILGYADVALEENVGPTASEYIEIIKRNGEHLLGVITGILDLSKVEAGQMQIDPVRCSPVQLVAEVVSLMRVRAEAKHLKLRADMIPPLPETIFTDPLRLRQVLVNLVGNAIKFTDHGEVGLAVRFTSQDGRPRLHFDVTDTGIGIREEHLAKLFQPFTQVDSSSARKFGGTGLGLCISKHLAEALGGDIEVCSEPGKGSTFSLTIDPGPLDGIPMIENTQEALLGHRPAATAATADKIELHARVLLAEDGPDNQRLISFLLKKAGAEVTAVENGQLAMEATLAQNEVGRPFDVILMDMQMPVMDGYEATRALRERGYTGPIVALTAHAMAEDRQKCLDAGCDDFATKPIDRQRLLTVVARWASQASSDRDSRLSSSPLV